MPGPKTQAEVIGDFEGLVEAAERNAERLEGSDKEYLALKQGLAEIKALKAEQEALTAQRQAVTQRFNAAVARTKEAAITFRLLVRAKIGHRNELLVHFKVAPLRKRAPRRQVASGARPELVAEPGTTSG